MFARKPATYEGKPCRHCHGATRYKANYKCVTCARADQAARYDKETATARKRAYRAELATLRAENEKLREALMDCEVWIRRYHYDDRPDIADKAKEALK